MGNAPVDLAAALHWAGGDRALLVELVGVFVEEAPRRLAELREATLVRDAPTVERLSHAIKGSAAILGASDLREASAALEERAMENRLEGEPALQARFESEFERVLAFFRDPGWPGRLEAAEP